MPLFCKVKDAKDNSAKEIQNQSLGKPFLKPPRNSQDLAVVQKLDKIQKRIYLFCMLLP